MNEGIIFKRFKFCLRLSDKYILSEGNGYGGISFCFKT